MSQPDIATLVMRVKKLFALAENNSNPHQAAEALRKAQQLIEQYDLDMDAVYYIQEQAMDLQEVTIMFKDAQNEAANDWVALLLYTICKYHFCYTLHYPDHVKVIGPINNVTHAMKMFAHVSYQVERMTDDWATRHGIVSRIRSRLVARRGKEVHGTGVAIVAQHRALIDTYVQQRYPDAVRDNVNPATLAHPVTTAGAWEGGFMLGETINMEIPEHGWQDDSGLDRSWTWMLGATGRDRGDPRRDDRHDVPEANSVGAVD